MIRPLLSLFALLLLGHPAYANNIAIRSVEATDETIEITLDVPEGSAGEALEVRAVPLLPHASLDSTNTELVWQGTPDGDRVSVSRRHEGRDVAFSRFQLVDAESGALLGVERVASAVAAPADRRFEFPRPKSIKGLQVQMVDDAIALGIKHAGLNVSITQLLSATSDSPLAIEVDGERVPINPSYVASLDARVKPLTDAGVNVLAIFLNTKYAMQAGSPLLHPETRLEEAPTFSVAFNLTTPDAARRFRAALAFLAERYSRPDAPHGWIAGYIIGNEVQSHWMWANRGSAPDEVVIDEYATALRIADLSVRSQHEGLRVYASFDHFWQAKFELPAGRSMPGRKLLDELNRISKQEGDFPWGVAMHPYPENLFNPKFWEDATAPLSFDAPRITLHNIEVLTSYLRQPEMMCGNEVRRVTLSEQGFHTTDPGPSGDEGEVLQAAAFARAFYKLQNLEGVDSFLLHRHVDHSDEGGLRLGLWTRRVDVPGSTPDRQKKIYDVFRLADTAQWSKAFEFAKAHVGIADWSEALPREIP